MTAQKERIVSISVLALILLYTCCFSFISYLKYHSFGYKDFDLAIYHQVLWNTTEGNFFYSSIRGGIYFKDHFNLILLCILPIYYFFRSPLTLLFLQSLFLGLGAWPLYLIARQKIEWKWSIFFVILYLLYPALGYVNLFEFHPISFSIFFLFFAFYYLENDRFIPTFIFLILAMLCRESIALITFSFGIYSLIVKKNKRWPFIFTLTSFLYFFLAVFIIIPYFNRGEYIYTSLYGHLGGDIAGIVKNLFLHPFVILRYILYPQKVNYLIKLLSPLAFLPLFDLSLIVILPYLLVHLLSAKLSVSSIYYQYSAGMIAFIFIPAILTWRKISIKFVTKRYYIWIFIGIFFISFFSIAILSPQLQICSLIKAYQPYYPVILKDKFISEIPKDTSCIATFEFLPKLSFRKELHAFHYVYFGKEITEKKQYILPEEINYALIDFSDQLTFKGFYTQKGGRNIRKFIEEGNWGIVKKVETLALLKRNYHSNEAFYSVSKYFLPVQNKVMATIDDTIMLVGYNLDKNSIFVPDVLKLEFVWKKLLPKDKDYGMGVQIFDKEANLVGVRFKEIGYHIYPCREWEKGNYIEEYYTLYLPGNLKAGKYSLFMEVIDRYTNRKIFWKIKEDDNEQYVNNLFLGEIIIK